MSTPPSFAALARAVHHGRHREALTLIDDLLAHMPDSAGLRRQRAACTEALALEEAASMRPPELVRVDARLFSFDQQRDCNAPAPELRALGLTPLLDAASPSFSRRGPAPVLIRFYGDESGEILVIRFSAVLQQRPAQLLACASMVSDGRIMLAQRDGDWPIAARDGLDVLRLSQRVSMAELVTRHVGRCATWLRTVPGLTYRPLRTLADCDHIWQATMAN